MRYMSRPQYGYYPQQNGYGEGYPMQNYAPPPPGMVESDFVRNKLTIGSVSHRTHPTACISTPRRRIQSQSRSRLGSASTRPTTWTCWCRRIVESDAECAIGSRAERSGASYRRTTCAEEGEGWHDVEIESIQMSYPYWRSRKRFLSLIGPTKCFSAGGTRHFRESVAYIAMISRIVFA